MRGGDTKAIFPHLTKYDAFTFMGAKQAMHFG